MDSVLLHCWGPGMLYSRIPTITLSVYNIATSECIVQTICFAVSHPLWIYLDHFVFRNNGCTRSRPQKDGRFIFRHFVWWSRWTSARNSSCSLKRTRPILEIHSSPHRQCRAKRRRKRMISFWTKFGNVHRANRSMLRCGQSARDVWRVTRISRRTLETA